MNTSGGNEEIMLLPTRNTRANHIIKHKSPNYKAHNCLCDFLNQKSKRDIPTTQCLRCKRKMHLKCMKIKTEEEAKLFECHSCILLNYDPLAKVDPEKVLIDPFYIKPGIAGETTIKTFVLDSVLYSQIRSNPKYGIEIRCVIVDGIVHEQTWPDAGELFINKQSIQAFNPLAANSALKKRRDEKAFIRYSNVIKQGRNELKVIVRKIKKKENKK